MKILISNYVSLLTWEQRINNIKCTESTNLILGNRVCERRQTYPDANDGILGDIPTHTDEHVTRVYYVLCIMFKNSDHHLHNRSSNRLTGKTLALYVEGPEFTSPQEDEPYWTFLNHKQVNLLIIICWKHRS